MLARGQRCAVKPRKMEPLLPIVHAASGLSLRLLWIFSGKLAAKAPSLERKKDIDDGFVFRYVGEETDPLQVKREVAWFLAALR